MPRVTASPLQSPLASTSASTLAKSPTRASAPLCPSAPPPPNPSPPPRPARSSAPAAYKPRLSFTTSKAINCTTLTTWLGRTRTALALKVFKGLTLLIYRFWYLGRLRIIRRSLLSRHVGSRIRSAWLIQDCLSVRHLR